MFVLACRRPKAPSVRNEFIDLLCSGFEHSGFGLCFLLRLSALLRQKIINVCLPEETLQYGKLAWSRHGSHRISYYKEENYHYNCSPQKKSTNNNLQAATELTMASSVNNTKAKILTVISEADDLHDRIEYKKADIVCKAYEINNLCQAKETDITSSVYGIAQYCEMKQTDIDCKVGQVRVHCDSKISEVTCKCDEVTTICDGKKTELKCKADVINEMSETTKY